MSTSARHHLFKKVTLLLLILASLALWTRVALASEPPLWEWVDAQVVTNSATSTQQNSDEEVLAKLASRLKKTSPTGLPSLRYFSFKREQLTSLRNGKTVDVAAPTASFAQVTLKSRSTNNLGVETLRASQASGDVTMSMSQKGDAISGTLIQDGQRWKLTVRGGLGIMYLDSELRSIGGKDGKENDAIEPPTKKNLAGVTSPTSGSESTIELPSSNEGPVTADVVAAYSLALLDLYGSHDGVVTRISDVFDATNKAYQDSGVALEVNLVDVIEVAVDRETELSSDLVLDMVAGFRGDTELFSHVREQTKRLGADFTAMFRPYANDGMCGIAYLGGKDDSQYIANNMISHTSLDCGDIVNAHEIGHNMGLNHSRRQDGSGHVYHYALGYGENNSFATVMAYPDAFNTTLRLNKFSSPSLDCNGSPCGIDHTDETNGADSVLALNNRAAQIGQIRERRTVENELVVVNVIGSGSIDYNGETCSADSVCQVAIVSGETLSLAESSDNTAQFSGWGGSCEGNSGSSCEITVTGTTNVIAYFIEAYDPIDLSAVFENGELTFETSRSNSWQAVSDSSAIVGEQSIRAGTAEHDQDSTLRTMVNEAGELSFWAKLSSEENYDKLLVSVNGEVKKELSGELPWKQYSVTLEDDGSENYQVDFTYQKDGSVSEGSDTAWLDDIRFESSAPPVIKTIELEVIGGGWVGGSISACPSSCSYTTEGGLLTLEVSDAGNTAFVGWGGDCRGTETACEIEVTEDIKVYAYFERDFSVQETYNSALDNNELSFTSPVNPWEVVQTPSYEGGSALASGEIGDTEQSSLATQVMGPGQIGFAYKISTEAEKEGLQFLVNGEVMIAEAGEKDWQYVSMTIPEGTHEFRWLYQKDGSNSEGDDRIYIDKVTWDGALPKYVDLSLSTVGDAGAIRASKGFLCRSDCQYQLVETPDSITLFAEPDVQNGFVRWEGACQGTNLSCEISLESDVGATAIFSRSFSYNVTASASEGGIVSPEQQQVTEGASAEVTATPLAGYSLSSIAGCNGTIEGDGRTYVTAPVYSDCTVNAEFSANLYRVTFDLGDYGTYTGGGDLEQFVRWGESAEAPQFDVVTGWHFAGWSNDFSKVTGNIDVAASYQFIEGGNQVTIELGGGGRMNLQPTQYISDDGYVEVLLTPEPGFRVRQKAAGTCPEGEWSDNRYRTGLINDSCSLSLGFSPVLKSGSLLLILSGQEDDEEDQQ